MVDLIMTEGNDNDSQENQNGQFGPIGSGNVDTGLTVTPTMVNTPLGQGIKPFVVELGIGSGPMDSGQVIPNKIRVASGSYPIIVPERPEKLNGVNFKIWQ